jgi:hypothetical protein
MRLLLCAIPLLLFGCPKKDLPSLEEVERKKQLQELLEDEDEIFDELPEAGEEDE